MRAGNIMFQVTEKIFDQSHVKLMKKSIKRLIEIVFENFNSMPYNWNLYRLLRSATHPLQTISAYHLN